MDILWGLDRRDRSLELLRPRSFTNAITASFGKRSFGLLAAHNDTSLAFASATREHSTREGSRLALTVPMVESTITISASLFSSPPPAPPARFPGGGAVAINAGEEFASGMRRKRIGSDFSQAFRIRLITGRVSDPNLQESDKSPFTLFTVRFP